MMINILVLLVEVVKFFINGSLSPAKVKTIPQVIIICITAMLTIFTVYITQNHEVCNYAVILNNQKQGL